MASHVKESGAAGVAHGLRSTTAARTWEDALIAGNGRQGALVFGDAAAVRLSLSHERLFLPLTAPLPAPETSRILPELRAFLRAGNLQAAADRVGTFAAEEHPGYAETRWIDPFVGAATLTFTAPQALAGHERTTDFATGLVTLTGQAESGPLTHRVFVSRPANAVVCRTAAPPGGLTGLLRLAPIEGEPPASIAFEPSVKPDELGLTASFPDRWAGAIA
ncbi:MAG: alpha-L-fucosidase, partial [Dactylosporangium sp.]|nr:glycoside hydrolase family 95 protein [Dactylosporangium sp.]NNJ62507.1 alpha-L-fucosidase [Dactylosporangium sp.]